MSTLFKEGNVYILQKSSVKIDLAEKGAFEDKVCQFRHENHRENVQIKSLRNMSTVSEHSKS